MELGPREVLPRIRRVVWKQAAIGLRNRRAVHFGAELLADVYESWWSRDEVGHDKR